MENKIKVRKRKRRRKEVTKEDVEGTTSSSKSPTIEPPERAEIPIASPRAQVKVKGLASMVVVGQIEGTTVEWKIDTGAKSTFITNETFDLILDKPVLEPMDSTYIVANGQKLKCLGKAVMSITLGGNVFEQEVVVGGVRNNLIGEDFIATYRCTWDHDESCFIVKGSRIPFEGTEGETSGRVIALETVLVPAGHEAVIQSGLTGRAHHSGTSSLGILTPERPFLERLGLALARTLVDSTNGVVYARVFNPGPSDIRVYKHTHIALFTPVCKVGPVLHMDKLQDLCEVEIDPSKNVKEVPEHLSQTFEKGCINLNEDQKEDFKRFLCRNHQCFARPGEVGRTHLGMHKINLEDNKPIREPPRRVPLYKRQALEEEIQKLEERGLIEKSSSPWSSQIVMVQKKDGSWRMCVDYRKLNEKTIKDAYPLTRIDENLDTLEGAEWYSSLDLDMAYHQVPMAEVDKEKTAFATPRGGLYQYTTMPFGLCNAASTFERIIEKALTGLQWQIAVLYLDDIVVFGKSFQNHLDNLQRVCDRLAEAGLKLKPKKCHLFQKEISFLGHIVSKSGTRTDPAKISAVRDMKRPSTVTQARSFLGLASYYRKYVKGFSQIAKPLFDLTKKNNKFVWNDQTETAFQELKNRLISAPILAFPQAEGSEFILDTDASNYAIGAVLSQVQDGRERVIAYGSRCLDKAERNYCVTRREMLSVVYFTKYFKHYLLGRRFRVRTDHGSLTWLQNFREPDGQVHRWIQQLSQFHMKIEHRPGARHGNADAMSRLVTDKGDFCKQCEMPWGYDYDGPIETEIQYMREGDKNVIESISDESDNERNAEPSRPSEIARESTTEIVDHSGESPTLRRGRKQNKPRPARQKPEPGLDLDLQSIRSEQERDEILGEILKLKTEKTDKPAWEKISEKSVEFKFWTARWELLEIVNDVLCMKWDEDTRPGRWKICLPDSMIGPICWYLHDARTSGHLGIKKTYERAKLSPFFWKGMKDRIKLYVSKCEICGERKNPPVKKRHFMKSYIVGAPFERIATDIAGPFPVTDSGNKYILVVGDYFTKLTEIYPMENMLAETVADIIFRAWIKRYGCPTELHSDQGRQYESLLFREICQMLEINKTRTTPLHPRSDGMIEKMNRTINDMLSKYIKTHQKDWDKHLDYITMAYNSTPHETTGFTPHRMVFGREMKIPLEVITETLENSAERFTSEYAYTLEKNLREAHNEARKHTKRAAKRQKVTYDTNVRQREYKVGELVWRNQKKNSPGIKAKIARHWTGPWVIIEKLSDIIFKIKCKKNSPSVVVHGDVLKPYLGEKKLQWFGKHRVCPTGNPEHNQFKFPDLNTFATDSENLACLASSYDQEFHKNDIEEESNDFNKVRTRPDSFLEQAKIPDSSARLSAGINDHMEDEHAHNITTRVGRKIKIPGRFLDTIDNDNSESRDMRAQCKVCGQQYANQRNLRRHMNSNHNDNVKFVGCPIQECDRIFFRREYLQIHLERSHGVCRQDAKEESKVADINYTERHNIEAVGQERRLRPQPTVQPLQDLHVQTPHGENVERVVIVQDQDGEDVLSLDSDTGEFDMEVGEIEVEQLTKMSASSSDEEEFVPNGNKTRRRTDQVPDFDGEVPGPSGAGTSTQREPDTSGEPTSEVDNDNTSVEVISLSLVTVRSTRNGEPHCRREHQFQTSVGVDPRNFDWRGFVEYMCNELFEHANQLRQQESNVTVREVESDEEA